MKHLASPSFWECYEALPLPVRLLLVLLVLSLRNKEGFSICGNTSAV